MSNIRPDDLAELWNAAEHAGRPEPVTGKPTSVLLRPEIIDPAGWHEIRDTVVLWIAAGAARLETGERGDTVPAAELAAVTDVADIYGLRLVFVEPWLAHAAAGVLTAYLRRPDLDHTLDPELRDL